MADFSHGGINHFTPEQQTYLRALTAALNNTAQQVNASPVGVTPPPQPHAAISVKGGAGIADIAITDNSDSFRGKTHAFDYRLDGGPWHTKDIGQAQNWRGSLGKGMLEVRSYAAYPTSAPSPPIYHAPVATGGSVEPPMQAGQNVGLPAQPFTGNSIPKRQ